MADYNGADRRGSSRRSDDLHCGNHEQNTTDLSGMKHSFSTLKWVLGTTIPIAVLIIGAFFSSIDTNISGMRGDLKDVKEGIIESNLNQATARMEIEQLKKDVSNIKVWMERYHDHDGPVFTLKAARKDDK